MATINKTKYGKWRALVRVSGWPTSSKNFRIKRDAETWARVTEDEMMRGIYAPRANSEKLLVSKALERYVNEVTPTKSPTTQASYVTTATIDLKKARATTQYGSSLRSSVTYIPPPSKSGELA